MPEGSLYQQLSRHLPSLYAFVQRRTGRLVRAKETESDLVQSTCKEILQHLDRFQGGGEVGFRQWLYLTAERKIIDRGRFYRAGKRNAAKEVPLPGDGSSSSNSSRREPQLPTYNTPSRLAIQKEQLEKLTEALDELSEDQRNVILLARVFEVPHAHIAQIMNRSEGAVRVYLHRALAKLAAILEASGSDPM